MSEKQKRKEELKGQGQTMTPFLWVGVLIGTVLIYSFILNFFSAESSSIEYASTSTIIVTRNSASQTQAVIWQTETAEAISTPSQ